MAVAWQIGRQKEKERREKRQNLDILDLGLRN